MGKDHNGARPDHDEKQDGDDVVFSVGTVVSGYPFDEEELAVIERVDEELAESSESS